MAQRAKKFFARWKAVIAGDDTGDCECKYRLERLGTMRSLSLDTEWFFPAIVGLWLAFSGFLSIFGGWHELAERFSDGKSLEGERFRFRSGAIGWKLFPVNYGNCLFVTVSQDGFALSILLIRFMHPKLVIPWSAVQRCEPVKFWFVKYIAVYINGFKQRILFSGSLGQTILDTWTRERETV
jgi:hypothetical protein